MLPQKMLLWPPFATSLPQSESKVASTQSKQGNNEWGVEAMLFRVVEAWQKLPDKKKLEKERENIRIYVPKV
jgi:hypothetical protein